MANIERYIGSPWNGIGDARADGYLAHSGHKVRRFPGQIFHAKDPLGRSREGVAPQLHRCRAGMVGLARKVSTVPALTYDGRNNAKGKSASFKDRSLFDVEFKEAVYFCGRNSRTANICFPNAKVQQCILNADALAIAQFEKSGPQAFHVADGPQVRLPESNPLFIGKGHNFIAPPGLQAGFPHIISQSNAQQYPEDSIVTARLNDGIEVGTGDYDLLLLDRKSTRLNSSH